MPEVTARERYGDKFELADAYRLNFAAFVPVVLAFVPHLRVQCTLIMYIRARWSGTCAPNPKFRRPWCRGTCRRQVELVDALNSSLCAVKKRCGLVAHR